MPEEHVGVLGRAANGGHLRIANCETMWCSMAAQENHVDDTVGAGFKPAHAVAVPQNPPNSTICVVLQLAQESGRRAMLTNKVIADHDAHVIPAQRLNLLNFMGRTESIEEMDGSHASFESRGTGNHRHVHGFPDAA